MAGKGGKRSFSVSPTSLVFNRPFFLKTFFFQFLHSHNCFGNRDSSNHMLYSTGGSVRELVAGCLGSKFFFQRITGACIEQISTKKKFDESSHGFEIDSRQPQTVYCGTLKDLTSAQLSTLAWLEANYNWNSHTAQLRRRFRSSQESTVWVRLGMRRCTASPCIEYACRSMAGKKYGEVVTPHCAPCLPTQ